MKPRYFTYLFLGGLFIWCGIFLSHKIDLTTADLGRHIQNGQVLVSAPWGEMGAVLRTNFYSYTMPEQGFVNHHWLSGIIFYVVYKILGFTGLSAFYVLVSLLSIFLFWNVARKLSHFSTASVVLLVLVPLLTHRAEVRPEMWTYLLCGVFLNLLVVRKKLWLLPPLMLLWVNLHIGFVFGFLILGAFLVTNFKFLWRIALATLLAALINPFGYKLLLYPFTIFANYGYTIVENQSVRFLERIDFTAGMHFLLFKISALALIASLALLLAKKIKVPWEIFAPAILVGLMAYLGIRNIPIFAFLALPALAYSLSQVTRFLDRDVMNFALPTLLVIAVASQCGDLSRLGPALGWGLTPQVLAANEFVLAHNLPGPIYNNYDIGGYLIFGLYPEQKVFVDNRPEAYTREFFKNSYIEPEQNESAWKALDATYHFQTIIFGHHDYTPWGQAFLASRLADPAWQRVFLDDSVIILVKKG